MTLITSLFSGWWTGILAGAAFLVALFASYFGGKKIGTSQTQAKADVKAAEVKSEQVQAVAEKQKENVKVVKDVQANNSALNDDAARAKLRQSSYNRKE